MLYGAMMGDYGGLYLPMMIVGYVFLCSVLPFDGKVHHRSMDRKLHWCAISMRCTGHVHWSFSVVVCYGSRGFRRFNCKPDDPSMYTRCYLCYFFGIGYGAYYATADMPIPMVADCSDYETFRSGQLCAGNYRNLVLTCG